MIQNVSLNGFIEANFNDNRKTAPTQGENNIMSYKSIKRVKTQMEIPGSTGPLEEALDDLVERLEEMDKIKESIPPAKERLAEIMMSLRKEKIFHKGRHFSVTSPEIKPKLRITKQKES